MNYAMTLGYTRGAQALLRMIVEEANDRHRDTVNVMASRTWGSKYNQLWDDIAYRVFRTGGYVAEGVHAANEAAADNEDALDAIRIHWGLNTEAVQQEIDDNSEDE
jgi:hypothetical protein